MAYKYKGNKDTLADIIRSDSEAEIIKWIDNNPEKFIQSIIIDSPLRLASEFGHTEVVKRIIDMIKKTYADIDEPNDSHIEIVDCEYHYFDEEIYYEHRPPLFYAIENKRTEIVKMLIEAGANVNFEMDKTQYSDNYHFTPLFIACNKGYTGIVKLLIEAGADVNKMSDTEYDDYDFTPLFIACNKRYTEIVKLLIEYGANVNIEDADITALSIAVDKRYTEIVKILIEAGANVDFKYEIYANNIDNIKLFIKAGANIDKKILNIAIKRENMDIDGIKIIKLLLNELMY